MKLLLVEDDVRTGAALQQYLSERGQACRWVSDGAAGLELIRRQEYDVVVLDVLLPSQDGWEVLRTARHEGILTPILLLTALSSVEERVNGFGLGADDYLVKPFECAELLARVKALQRRSRLRPSPIVDVGGVNLDLSLREVAADGTTVTLTPTEASLLEFLMRYAGELVTRKMIGKRLWDDDWDNTTNVVDVNINRLRAKLHEAFGRRLIHTVRGRGYVFRLA